MAEVFTWIPSYGTDKKTKYRVRKSSYGDGYEQTLEDGLNSVYQEWTVVFRVTSAIAEEIDAFLVKHRGSKPFLWTPPGSPTQLIMKCEGEHSRAYNGFNDETITATFSQKFGALS